MSKDPKSLFNRLAAPFTEIFGLSRELALLMVLFSIALIVAAVFWFFHSAPPRTFTMTSGAPGSSLQSFAEQYRDFLKERGVTLKILSSEGSLENLHRLDDPSVKVDVGFVQGGITNDSATEKLVSLGSVNYQPLLVFYHSATPVTLLSGFAGKRVSIGPVGSGTRSLALELFKLNGIEPGGTTIFTNEDALTPNTLLSGKLDAVFLMSDSTATNVMRQLLRTPGIQLFDFIQADGYTRRINYISKLELPEGSIDFGKNLPSHDVNLIGPTVEIIARHGLHPALSDLLIEAAQKVNGKPGLFKHRNEFPAPLEHDFPISDDATRYYKSGKGFFYGMLPFWLASLVSRIAVSFVPLIVVLIPALKLIPAAFKWRMRTRINRWYRELLALEKHLAGASTPGKHEHLIQQLENIETQVNRMKVPASFADQFYGLRGHIQFVRDQLPKNGKA